MDDAGNRNEKDDWNNHNGAVGQDVKIAITKYYQPMLSMTWAFVRTMAENRVEIMIIICNETPTAKTTMMKRMSISTTPFCFSNSQGTMSMLKKILTKCSRQMLAKIGTSR